MNESDPAEVFCDLVAATFAHEGMNLVRAIAALRISETSRRFVLAEAVATCHSLIAHFAPSLGMAPQDFLQEFRASLSDQGTPGATPPPSYPHRSPPEADPSM